MDAPRILIVEDELITARALALMITNMGYQVVGTEASGPGAIATAKETLPDLVLMDITLEGPMDGIEAAAEILATHDTAIVYLTAYTQGPKFERAMASENYGCVSKPVSPHKLKQTIEAAVLKKKTDR